MIACNLRHPERPEVICSGWSYHRDVHAGWPDGAPHTPQNEVTWPLVAEEAKPCSTCGATDGHLMRCGVIFDPHFAFRGGNE